MDVSKPEYAQGPWHYDGEYVWADSISGYVADPNTEDLASGNHVAHCDAQEMIDANGRLIAAAPDLLEALQVTVEVLERMGETQYIEQARAAIARAIGED
jgi:hypothetical protein